MFQMIRLHAYVVFALCVCCLFLPPSTRGGAGKRAPAVSRLDPGSFRCIFVGDSQTTVPYSARVLPQTHRWDIQHGGAQLGRWYPATGSLVHNNDGGLKQVEFHCVDPRDGWPNGGDPDFFSICAANWTLLGDVDDPGARVGRYRIGFGGDNTDAPWSHAWGVNTPLVARIAVRTSPNCVGAIDTVPERGGVVNEYARTTHYLSQQWGIQILEQPIPLGTNPHGQDAGIGLYFPDGHDEHAGEMLQVLGVFIERVTPTGQRAGGAFIGFQGDGGWNIGDHLQHISTRARGALAYLIEPEYIVIALGHNREPGGMKDVEPSLRALRADWEKAYAMLGRERPSFVYLTLWPVEEDTATDYMRHVEVVMRELAREHRADQSVSMLSYFGYTRPDVLDPERYRLDVHGVHPGDVPSAVHLAEDLYGMLFEGRRE